MLKHLLKIVLGLLGVYVIYMLGCSQTYFGSLKRVSCEDFEVLYGADKCQSSPESSPEDELVGLEFTYTARLGEVDIIFVVDNSGSMSREHRSLALQMQPFLNAIRNLDYRIAIITTDISSSPNNPKRGADYQDGKFLRIGGSQYLTNSAVGKRPDERDIDDFVRTLVRPETLACDEGSDSEERFDRLGNFFETGVYPEKTEKASTSKTPCPSSDERAIYALNLAIENSSQRSFFRRDAHLMVVIISDEDERSGGEFIDARLDFNENYTFEHKDYPKTLVETVYHHLGQTMSVHSIVVPIKGSCLREQNKDTNKGGRGYPGETYIQLSKAVDPDLVEDENVDGTLLKGSIISICDRDYSSQLGRIAIAAEVPKVSLPCSDPENIRFRVNGRKTHLNFYIEGRSLIVEDKVSIGSDLEISLICNQ